MFTGLVEEMGVVQSLIRQPKSASLSVMAQTVLKELSQGESVSVNGVCLTVTGQTDKEFQADVSPETLNVTNLGSLKAGDAVNLERAVRVNSRLGGHLVTGHIDGVGVIRDRKRTEDYMFLKIDLSEELLRYCVRKGSVSIDGVSLTVNEVGLRKIEVAIIPHTAKATTLGLKAPGATVNIECDLIGKYVERLLQSDGSPSRIAQEFLKKKGLL